MTNLHNPRKVPFNKAMGIEIESYAKNSAEIRYSHMGFFYVSEDGSLRGRRSGENAFEFVSQPLTPIWLKREVDKLFKKILSPRVDAYCGIHIHVSRQWLSSAKAMKIATMLASFNDEQMKEIFGRCPGRYCQNRGVNLVEKYTQVNFRNDKTIEFRGFRSGDAAWAKYCIDVVCSLITYEGDGSFQSVLDWVTNPNKLVGKK